MNISDKVSDDEYYNALINRDGSYVGTFVVGVVTTGICCLPTCRAKKPKRENCEFFPSVGDALRAGYRPCRICRPAEEIGSPPPDVSSALEMVRTMPDRRITDQSLRDRGISPGAVRRWCKTHLGLTFQGYQRMLRINSAYRALVEGSTVTDAAFDGGYESLSGFTHSFRSVMQTSPSAAGRTSVITIDRIPTPLGPMFAGAADDGLCLLEFTDRRMLEKQIATITRLLKARVIAGSHSHIQTAHVQLKEYFAGTRTKFDIPLVVPGTEFQKAVWESLRTVPYGETWSYARQAAFLGRPAAIRAVAVANGYNRVSIIVPCHRIIGSDGSLTGYGGGLARKRQLLELEKRHRLSPT
jgi:AraC family transcriptional regulator, regulatory protein of adaptative response / methylated-DNA-[protein]-cysteine methyltransferase